MPSIHILIDTVFFTRPYSGISKVWETILANLPANNNNSKYQITLLHRAGTTFKNPGLNLSSKFNIVQINAFNYATMGCDVDYLNQIAKECKGNVFISTYYTYCTCIPNWLMIYDMIPEIFKMPSDPMWIQKDLAIKNACYFSTISNNTQHDLIKFYPHIARTPYILKTIYISVPPISNIIPDNTFISSAGIAPKSYIFAVVTNFEPYKNAKLITDFAQRYTQQLKTLLASNYPIILLTKTNSPNPIYRDNVLYLNNVSAEMLSSLYKNACAVVVPSLYEGFGLPIVEALQYETPVFAIKNAVFDEVVGDSGSIVYFDNDVEDLWRVISKFLGDSDASTKFRDNVLEQTKLACSAVNAAYTPYKQIAAIEEFIDSISCGDSNDKAYLNVIIQTYPERDANRLNELKRALSQNLANPYVKTVWDLGDSCNLYGEDITKHPKFKRGYNEGDPDAKKWVTYQTAFDFAARKARKEGEYWCLTNLDIYLDSSSTWNLVCGWLNRGYIIALSRHEHYNDGSIVMDSNFDKLLHAHTQDAWLFKSSVKIIDANFELGMLGCDNGIADRIVKSGYRILNAPKQFKIIHVDNAKGKNSANFVEKHKENANKIGKPKNKHPERTGCMLVPNYDKICEMFSGGTGGTIDLNAVAAAFGADNMEKYEFICKLITSRVKIQNPD